MKLLKKLFLGVALFLTTIIVLAYAFNVDYLIKAIRTIYIKGHQTAYLEDYKEFDNGTITKSDVAQPWAIHKNYNKIKELCPQLSFDEIMRLIDLFKSGAINI